ncbi:hypothetical protein RD792_012527 [Penstemon davidsonii]|uniref:Uncharacterized protein n=1 Tax=Penstemon davidsonii TaxID=160366 RepID=A0ABR0CX36_9LAMI|nr:hypothetical protein RD792_012527 [Penstemon davidsonii]
MVPILFLFLCFQQIRNGGPYTGLNDGRIVKFQDSETGFVDFATTTSNRSKELCDGTNGSRMNTSLVCGKPIGLEFNHKTNELYIADAYHGLFVVGMDGGVATKLSGETHFDYADGIDIDPIEGVIYITDLGNVFSHGVVHASRYEEV